MKQIIKLFIIVGLYSSLTNFVFAQGEPAPAATVDPCPACSTGSPQMQAYMIWMREIIATLNTVPNKDPGAVAGQQNNITRKNKETSQRAELIKDTSLKITKQAPGVKSDARLLNKLRDDLVSVANTLINTKSQRNIIADPAVIQKINQQIAAQIGGTKLLSGSQSLSSTMTYQELMGSLIDLHRQVASLTAGTTGSIISWQGYQGNKVAILKLTSYYSCAKSIPVCRKETSALNETAANIKGYWGDILRAWGQITQSLSKQYWTINTKRSGSAIQFGEGFSNLTQWSEDAKKKRAAKKEQEAKQANEVEILTKSQDVIKASPSEVSIPATETQFVNSTNDASYNQQEGRLLIAALNEASNESLSNNIETQKYTILSDSREITYNIHNITEKIYNSGKKIATSANSIKSSCEEHCSNVKNGSCGSTVQSS